MLNLCVQGEGKSCRLPTGIIANPHREDGCCCCCGWLRQLLSESFIVIEQTLFLGSFYAAVHCTQNLTGNLIKAKTQITAFRIESDLIY